MALNSRNIIRLKFDEDNNITSVSNSIPSSNSEKAVCPLSVQTKSGSVFSIQDEAHRRFDEVFEGIEADISSMKLSQKNQNAIYSICDKLSLHIREYCINKCSQEFRPELEAILSSVSDYLTKKN